MMMILMKLQMLGGWGGAMYYSDSLLATCDKDSVSLKNEATLLRFIIMLTYCISRYMAVAFIRWVGTWGVHIWYSPLQYLGNWGSVLADRSITATPYTATFSDIFSKNAKSSHKKTLLTLFLIHKGDTGVGDGFGVLVQLHLRCTPLEMGDRKERPNNWKYFFQCPMWGPQGKKVQLQNANPPTTLYGAGRGINANILRQQST